MTCILHMTETRLCRRRKPFVAAMFRGSRREQAIADGLRSPLPKIWDVCIMNAYVSREERQVLPADLISYPQHYAEASYRRRFRLSALLGRVRAYFKQRAVLAELNRLSDRELADIGLSRTTIPSVFANQR